MEVHVATQCDSSSWRGVFLIGSALIHVTHHNSHMVKMEDLKLRLFILYNDTETMLVVAMVKVERQGTGRWIHGGSLDTYYR